MFGLVDRGNKNNLNSVWVMFGYYRNYLVPIGKKLNTNEKLNLSLDKHLLEWKLQGVESLKEKCPPSGEGRVWIFFGTTQNEHP